MGAKYYIIGNFNGSLMYNMGFVTYLIYSNMI